MARHSELVAAAAGLIVLVVGALIVGDGTVPAWEEEIFRRVNGLPGWLYPVLWPGNLIGSLAIVPIVATAAVILRRYRLAVAVVVAGVAKLVTERIVKALVSRQRPATSIGVGINTRGDVSISGESFVSGHAVLAAVVATVVAPHVPRRARVVVWLLVVVVIVARVYVGAHNPLDVVCGAGLGIAIGVLVNIVLRAPRRSAVA